MKLIRILVEALGVPEGIISTNKKVYEELLNELEKKASSQVEAGKFSFEIKGPFKIKDYQIEGIYVDIHIHVDKYDTVDNIEYYGASVFNRIVPSKDYTRYQKYSSGKYISLTLNISVSNKDRKWEEVLNFLKNNRKVISSLAHELKHAYDSYKNKTGHKVKSDTVYDYSIRTNRGTPVDQFLNYIYYTHYIENLVRPTEVAARLDHDNVTKKDFLKALKEDEVYKKLQDAKTMTYEKLLDQINRHYDQKKQDHIKKYGDDRFYRDKNIDPENYLSQIYEEIKKQIDEILAPLRSTIQNDIFNLTDDQIDKLLNNTIAKIKQDLTKYKDAKSFFKAQEKVIHRNADIAIRKLGKIYDTLD